MFCQEGGDLIGMDLFFNVILRVKWVAYLGMITHYVYQLKYLNPVGSISIVRWVNKG